MANDYLEINKLSPSGDVERRINCISGRITVFRSTKDEETALFNAALSGKSPPGSFSILLDGDSFDPNRHNFVGFGERFAISSRAKVAEYLEAVPAESRERVLLSCGIGGLSDVYCGELSPTQERILRILKGSLEPEKVLILNDPFAGIPDRFREILAERLTRFAWEKKAIVVVTKLSSRPEAWIENEFISRVQLQRPRQATIGFGSGDESVNKMIELVRKSAGAEVAPTGKPIDLLVSPGTKVTRQSFAKSSWFPLGVAALILLALLPFGISTLLNTEDPSVALHSGLHTNSVQSGSNHRSGTDVPTQVAAASPEKEETKTLLLDGFPGEISEGIRMAFLGKSVSSSQRVLAVPESFGMDQAGDGESTIQKLLFALREGNR